MANTIPSYGILSMENFPGLRKAAARLDRYSKNVSGEIASAGTSVAVGYEGNFSASLWTAASGYTTSDSTISSVTVTMQEPYHVEVFMSPNEVASYGESYMQRRMANVAAGVLDEVKAKALQALTNAATVTVAAVSASWFTFDTVLSGSTVLQTSGSQGAQTLLAPLSVYNALLADAKANNYQIAVVSTDGQDVLKYALLPNIDIVKEPGLTAPIITTQDGAALALRLPEQMAGHQRTLFTDAGKTEAVIAVDMFEDGVAGKIKMRAQACAGFATGRPGCAAKYTIL